MHYLLLSCSNRKTAFETPVRAIDLYNGVFFSVYKKALRSEPTLSSCIKLMVISAKYGLIEDNAYISYYDQRMTASVAAKQRDSNTAKLKSFIERDKPESIVIVMGSVYLQSIDYSDMTIPYRVINGEIGTMLHDLKEWLKSLPKE